MADPAHNLAIVVVVLFAGHLLMLWLDGHD